MRELSFEEYRKKWLGTSQPKPPLADLEITMIDKRTIAEIPEDGDATAGYIWVTFTDIKDYNITMAEIIDIAVAAIINAEASEP